MAGIGQQRLVAAHQGLDALGRQVEGGGHGGHLVLAGVVHPLGQITGTEGLHALLQRLEPAGEPAHHRIGPRRHGDEQQRHQHQRTHRARQPERHGQQRRQRAHRRWPLAERRPWLLLTQQRPALGAQHHHAANATAVAPGQDLLGGCAFGPWRTAQAAAPRQPQRAAVVQAHGGGGNAAATFAPHVAVGRGDAHAAAVVQGQGHLQPCRPVTQRLGLLDQRRVCRGQRALHQIGPGGQPLAGGGLQAGTLLVDMVLPHQPGDQREERQRGDHRQPDAQVERLHARARLPLPQMPPSPPPARLIHRRPACGRRHSPSHARSAPAWASWGRPRCRRGCARHARRCCGRRPPSDGP